MSGVPCHRPDTRVVLGAGLALLSLARMAFRSSVSYADPVLRPLLDLEGLKAWCDGRTSGYEPLEKAVDALGFYDGAGSVTARDYRP